jgi:hypothetical protein
MGVSRRGNKWAVTVYDPATRSKRWVGTYEKKQDARTAEGEARKQVRPPARPGGLRRVRPHVDRPLPP